MRKKSNTLAMIGEGSIRVRGQVITPPPKRKSLVLAKLSAAIEFMIEPLEGRILLSVSPSDYISGLPSSEVGELTPAGLQISLAPVRGQYTPDYDLLDTNPQLTTSNTLAPFATSTPTGMTAANMRHAYGVDQLSFGGIKGDGTGQTIAIIDAYDYPTASADLHQFDLAFGLPDPPSFTQVNETGGSTPPSTDPSGKGDDWEIEEALDVEWSHAMAPGANIVLVEASAPDDADLITAAVGYARSAPGVVAVTMSFGRPEDSTDSTEDPLFTTPAGHGGVTFLASTGDSGAPGGFPAFSPNVVAVGGTTLTTDGSGDYISEAGWYGSGGGVSSYETQPAFQNGIVTQSTTQRTIPDVSFDADPYSGASIYDSYDFGPTTPWETVGGTSLASPSWAGLIAVADQGRTLGGGGSLDGATQTLPKLYSIPASNYHDILTGNNGYPAGVGYDLVTGRGTPVANSLIPLLAAAGPFVTGTSPTGAATTPVSSINFNFSGTMDPTSFSVASDVDSFTGPGNTNLLSQITGYSWLNSNTTLQVTFAAQSTVGRYNMVIGPQILSIGGVAMDQNQDGVPGEVTGDEYTGTFGYETALLQVASTNPANGSIVELPFTTLDVHFNQAIDASTLDDADLSLSQGTVTAASLVDPSTAAFTLSGVTTEGTLTVSMAAGAINDAFGFPMLAYSGSFTTDIGIEPLPAATSVAPSGSLIYQSSASGTIGTPTDTDSFTYLVDAGETLTVTVIGAAALEPTLQVTDPQSNVVGSTTASAAGKPVILQTLPVTQTGTYTFIVGSANGTEGTYTVGMTLNAAESAENYGGATNQSLASAQDISGSFLSLGGNASRGAVMGSPSLNAGSLLYNNFENGLGGFVIANTIGGLWHLSTGRGSQAGHSAVQSLYFGQGESANGGGNYNTGSRVAGTVTSPSFTIPAGSSPSLNFNYVLQTEDNASFDQALVQISTDGGSSFTTLTNLSGTAESSTWRAATPISLGAYAGQTVELRFSFDTIDAIANNYEGWYVDDVSVGGSAATVNDYYSFSLAAGDSVSLALKATTAGSDTFSLLDGNGNTLASGSAGPTNVDSAISNFIAPASGKYYVLVSGGSAASNYDLVVTRNLVFSLQNHDSFSTAQSIGNTQGALGDLGNSSTGGTTVTLNGLDNGWYDYTGYHDSTNENYNVGETTYEGELRDYFVFSLAGITQPIASAQLNIYNPIDGFSSVKASETYGIFDVSTPVSLLESSGSGETSIFSDLGSGVSYGSTSVSDASNGQIVTVNLNSAATAALNADLGNQFAVGGAITTISGTSGQYLFGFTAGTETRQLVLTLGDAADWYSINVSSPGQTLAFSTSTPGDGPVALNTLDPHIELYDPNGNLVASGTKLNDGRNELLDYQALMAGAYRIRVVAQNGTNGEYVLNQGNALVLNVPANVKEGDGTDNGTITATTAPTSNLTVTLTSSDPSRISVPATLVLPAGQSSISLPLTVIDDNLLNGPEAITITVSGLGYFTGSSIVTIHDNETATLGVSLPSNTTEGVGTIAGTVSVSAPPTQNIVVSLVSSLTSRLTVPATVTIDAGQTTASFFATVVNTTAIDGTQNVTVTASEENWTSGSAIVAVAHNNNYITVSTPASGWEGQTLTTGILTIGGTLSTALVINLISNDTRELTVPATVTMPAGQTSVSFNLTLLDDGLKDGSQTATVTASASGLTSGSSSVVVHDSDLDYVLFNTITGPQTAGTPFTVTASAYNIANELIAVYSGTGTLSATGSVGTVPVSPTSFVYSAGIWNGSVTLTVADPTVKLTAISSGVSETSNSFLVQPGAVAGYTWGSVSSPQIANVPFPETLTAKDAYGNVATNLNGTANLSGLVGTTTSQTILGGPTYTYSGDYTPATLGYSFTPSSNFQVTAVRSFFGSKVSIWTDSGTLLASQAVTAPGGVWTETPLATPITLLAGNTYRVGAYENSTYYWSQSLPNTSPVGTINQSYEYIGDGFPSSADSVSWWFVDLRGNLGAFTNVPITPATATFANGLWSGNISVTQGATAMHLHAADGLQNVGDSSSFNVILRTLTLSLPSDVRQDDGVDMGLLSVAPTPNTNLIVTLTSSDPSRLSVPATITILAGQSSVYVPLTLIPSNLLEGLESVTITASAATYSTSSGSINVHDNESVVLSVSLPASAKEGDGTITGTITSSTAPAENITINLSSSNSARLTVPATVTLLAGQTTAIFNLSVIDDNIIDGNVLVTIGAAADEWTSGFKAMLINDNDNTIAITLPPSGWEGQTLTGAGTVTIGGTSSVPVIVNLVSNNTSELNVPASVTIPAGQTSAVFTLTLLDDGLTDGSQTVTVTGSAAGLTNGSSSVIVQDSDPDYLAFNPITSSQTAGTPFPVTAQIYNINNQVIAVYNGTGTLSAFGNAGNLSVSPSSITFSDGVWTGNVTLTTADPTVHLSLTSGGVTGSTGIFVVQPGAVSSFTWGTLPTTQTVDVPFPATLTANDAYGNVATNYSGTANLTGQIGSAVSETMLGNPVYSSDYDYGTYTLGYSFTPNTNVQVTAVRSYFGAKVSIWNSAGTLLASQAVSGTPTVWTETPLTTPITLLAGQTYRVGVYNNGLTYYGRNDMSSVTPFGTINQELYTTGDGAPIYQDGWQWIFVDLRGNVGSFTSVPVTPTTAAFTNGVWTGNVTATQPATSMHLHVDDGSSHTGDSSTFNVVLGPPTVVTPAAASPSPVTGTTTNLTVLGADFTGESNLTYNWTATGPAAVTYTANTTNAAKSTTAAFTKAGNYVFTVTITNGSNLTITSTVNVAVNPAVSSIALTPGEPNVADGQTKAFSAGAFDQFNNPMSSAFTWSVDSGGVGSVDGTGLYSAPAGGPGSATVRATCGSVSGSASLTVTFTTIMGTSGNDNILLTRSGSSFEVFSAGSLLYPAISFASLGALAIDTLAGNDTITVDFSGGASPVSATGLTVDGGAGADSLIITGTPSADSASINASSIQFDGSQINYQNMESIAINSGAGADSLTQTAQPSSTLTFSPTDTDASLYVDAGTFTIPASTSGIQPVYLNILSTNFGATVTVAGAPNPLNRDVLVLGVLSDPGTLDLGANDLILQGGGKAGLVQITTQLASGFNAGYGYWNGSTGIVSSAAAKDSTYLTTLGVMQNTTGSSFDNQPSSVGDILVKYTYYGDANLDGAVNGADYQQIDYGFGAHLSGWSYGDFNYDGAVDGNDFALIDNAFNQLTAGAASPLNPLGSVVPTKVAAGVASDLVQNSPTSPTAAVARGEQKFVSNSQAASQTSNSNGATAIEPSNANPVSLDDIIDDNSGDALKELKTKGRRKSSPN